MYYGWDWTLHDNWPYWPLVSLEYKRKGGGHKRLLIFLHWGEPKQSFVIKKEQGESWGIISLLLELQLAKKGFSISFVWRDKNQEIIEGDKFSILTFQDHPCGVCIEKICTLPLTLRIFVACPLHEVCQFWLVSFSVKGNQTMTSPVADMTDRWSSSKASYPAQNNHLRRCIIFHGSGHSKRA